MKIEKRKNTTKAGLKEFQKLLDTTEEKMGHDLADFFSETFTCAYSDYNRDYNYEIGRFAYISGQIKLQVTANNWQHIVTVRMIEFLEKINFSEAFEALWKFVEKYNQLSEKKNQEIDSFLKKVAEIKEMS